MLYNIHGGKTMRKLKNDLTGNRYERIVVLQRAENKNGRVAYLCKCDCGKEFVTLAQHITRGFVKSCGCGNREKASQRMTKMNTTHGHSGTRLYGIWQNMRSRCYNKHNPAYKSYGGRGIFICNEWNNYLNFEEWAISTGYTDELTIDRINVNKEYSPKNCRWTTRKIQGNNKRTNFYITYHGETKTLAEWADILKMPYSKLKFRLYQKWDIEKAFTNTNYGKKKVQCVETGEIFESAVAAAQSVNVTQSAIANVCRGAHSKCKGLSWKYI